jgi:hypothetical protein
MEACVKEYTCGAICSAISAAGYPFSSHEGNEIDMCKCGPRPVRASPERVLFTALLSFFQRPPVFSHARAHASLSCFTLVSPCFPSMPRTASTPSTSSCRHIYSMLQALPPTLIDTRLKSPESTTPPALETFSNHVRAAEYYIIHHFIVCMPTIPRSMSCVYIAKYNLFDIS